MSGGTATTITLTPAEENKADKQCLVTILVNLLGMPFASARRHPIYLALKNNGIVHFHDNFIHVTVANIDSLQHRKTPCYRCSCPSQNEFQDDASSTSCFLSPHVAQKSWRHQHPIQCDSIIQDQAQSNGRNCPMGYDPVQE